MATERLIDRSQMRNLPDLSDPTHHSSRDSMNPGQSAVQSSIQSLTNPAATSFLQVVIESLNDGIIITDQSDRILHINSRLAKLIGIEAELMVGEPAQPFLGLIEGWLFFSQQDDGPATPSDWCESQLRRRDGRQFWAEVNSTPLFDNGGQPLGNLIRVTDITERKWLEEYLRLLESVVVNANEMVMISQLEPTSDPLSLRIIYINNAFLTVTGYRAGEVIGKNALLLVGEETSQVELARVRQSLGKNESVKAELLLYRKDRTCFWADINTVPIHNEHGQVTHFVSVMREATERKEAEERLRRNAFHDSLTGLPNRLMFMDRLGQTVERLKQDPTYQFAILFLDLDRFKVINDSLGHLVGDELLIGIARRLERCVHSTDMVARLGGDEFTVLLEDIPNSDEAAKVADRIHEELALPFNLSGNEVFTSTSIGIAMSSPDLKRAEDLIRGADIAMYRAKASGKSCHELFDTEMHDEMVSLLQLENDLRRAIDRQEFDLYYQPIVSLSSGRIAGFEALVRWNHPTQGLIGPGKFISIAEETGLIMPLGEWVLREACQQLRQWQFKFSHLWPMTVSVNLSGRQFSHPGLTDQLRHILEDTGLAANFLKLEITESVIMENTEAALGMLAKIKEMGLQLSVDDFGTGYSSLGYLYRFPMDVLKIDRSFISRVDVDGEKLELVRTITTLAWNLGMDVVAEGVETTKQLAQLKALKCEYGQGHLFSKPICAKDMEAFLSRSPHPLQHLAHVLPIAPAP
ncbi:MAG: EAL domain-containing protein [Alkalinema sp. RU_4_3]|nr:EAL domain-containing protein [Alkalinema sp. RU_4_3]